MLNTLRNAGSLPVSMDTENESTKKKLRPVLYNRAHSTSPVAPRPQDPTQAKNLAKYRRCQSHSPSNEKQNPNIQLFDSLKHTQQTTSAPHNLNNGMTPNYHIYQEPEKDVILPQCIIIKTMRALATRKREFLKLKKNLIAQQNLVLEQYALLKELETRVGAPDEALSDIRVLTLRGWPAHDILLLLRDDLNIKRTSEISGIFGPQVLQQLMAQLNPVPEEVLSMGAELMARRIELLKLLRCKHRSDRATYLTNMEWKAKNDDFDTETEQLQRMVAGTAENLKAKMTYSIELAKIPWIDRDSYTKKIERLQKENATLQCKIEELTKKSNQEAKITECNKPETDTRYQTLNEELSKERANRESLKEVVASAESMLRVARARIVTLERQLKEASTTLETTQRKYKDLEHLYRHRKSSYDARSKKLMEVSKTGELTIESLSRQRDALELRVKELRDQAEASERAIEARQAQERARVEMLQAKEKCTAASNEHVTELECRIKELEEQLIFLRERSTHLVDMERKRCFEYIPSRESEPSDRETEIWKELQATRVALSRAEDEVRHCKADKDSFLNSLSKIAQEEGGDKEDKMAAELLSREQKIMKLQQVIDEQQENEKIMEHSMTEYENQLAALRLEVKQLRNYELYTKEISHQDLQTELLELSMQVEQLTRERSALVTTAASRALMLERHERSADLFTKMTRARRELTAFLENGTDPPAISYNLHTEISRSLTSMCARAADTWSALRAERARVLHLESAVLAHSLQLEKEGRVRTQLERRKTLLEREIVRTRHTVSTSKIVKNRSLVDI
ncbi:protein MLP1 homolog isoform X2 [Pararge aegeria]|uniref:protein MLP1 homolog isoform X2 n=1 Tax=Pararge aegeria TaxID=116150 RepID=UPI0019D27878|nr:protein MLP1 homolog isoform X2 [Pararge aegeria]